MENGRFSLTWEWWHYMRAQKCRKISNFFFILFFATEIITKFQGGKKLFGNMAVEWVFKRNFFCCYTQFTYTRIYSNSNTNGTKTKKILNFRISTSVRSNEKWYKYYICVSLFIRFFLLLLCFTEILVENKIYSFCFNFKCKSWLFFFLWSLHIV